MSDFTHFLIGTTLALLLLPFLVAAICIAVVLREIDREN
jgi:hypothetical protein